MGSNVNGARSKITVLYWELGLSRRVHRAQIPCLSQLLFAGNFVIPFSARAWIALSVGLAVLIGGGLYFNFLTASSAPTSDHAIGHNKPTIAFVGTPAEIEQHRQALIDKFLLDYKVIHPAAADDDARKLKDSAETYVNDRIAQSGETWRFNKVTGKPDI